MRRRSVAIGRSGSRSSGSTTCGDAIRAGAVNRPRHPDRAAELLDGHRDARVVGGDDDRVDRRRRGGPVVDVLDHRPSGQVGERFAGEARRLIAGGDDGDDSCGL
jgi:hypothetical protein